MSKNNNEKFNGIIKETGNIISSFKKFSEMNTSKEDDNETTDVEGDITPAIPASYNVPNKKTKKQVPADTSYIQPEPENAKDNDKLNKETDGKETKKASKKDENVDYYGKVAKFNKRVKASNAYNYLESVKISKNSIWYIMVEKQDSELQMVKYNYKAGVDLAKFVSELKEYYKKSYKDPKVVAMIENIKVGGNDKFSTIQNIPMIEIGGRKMISKITEDLIKLLSK